MWRLLAAALLAAVSSCAIVGNEVLEERQVERVKQTIRDNYLNEVREDELAAGCEAGKRGARIAPPEPTLFALTNACVRAMVATLGGAADVYEGDLYAAPGLELSSDGGRLHVVRTVAVLPGARAGIMPGDAITRIDGADTSAMPMTEVLHRLRGLEGSRVVLSVGRAGEAPREVALARALLEAGEPVGRLAPGGIFYYRIPRFEPDTLARFGEALRQASKPAPVEAIILDLRGNPGGILVGGLAIAAAFLPAAATVVELRSRAPGAHMKLTAARGDHLGRFEQDPIEDLRPFLQSAPLAVWVDRASGGGAEIAAAALQDYRRAVIVGLPTAGVNVVTTLFPFGKAFTLKIPTSRWERPSGKRAAITPNFELEFPADRAPDDALLVTIAQALRARSPPR